MKKSEIVAEMATFPGVSSKAAAQAALDALTALLTDTLAEEGVFRLPGVGKFVVAGAAARTARNPRTGEPVAVPARRRVSFHVSDVLKAHVNRRTAA
ncbi:HU family DNA-binding protein [Streptosporangium saharense]|uniref:HU family DNA-binding protein n=1 Tax=Streptosporangium saharense TaxID=1706840 RepID=UPI0036B98DD0